LYRVLRLHSGLPLVDRCAVSDTRSIDPRRTGDMLFY
jgi:hypothetical protein